VSTPVEWAEVERAARTRSAEKLVFEAAQILRRVDRKGDMFASVLVLRQRLPSSAAIERASAR
jgi:bifunctional non-homologous end joining protein LigD